MANIIKHIPNSITCMNLLSGCLACLFAFEGKFEAAALCIGAAAVFDFADGLAARLLHAYSAMGKELDSLADLVSFGLAPSLLIFTFIKGEPIPDALSAISSYIPYLAFLITIFSALRLAKFNIDTRQTTSFIGLPVPANALFWVGICFWGMEQDINLYILLGAIIVFSYLLVSEIPMFSLKFKDLSFKNNYIRFLLIACSILLIAMLGISGLSAVIGLYIILSLISSRQ